MYFYLISYFLLGCITVIIFQALTAYKGLTKVDPEPAIAFMLMWPGVIVFGILWAVVHFSTTLGLHIGEHLRSKFQN